MILCVDIETCSAASIKQGNDAYAEHESTRVWCVSFAWQDSKKGRLRKWSWRPGMKLHPQLRDWIASGNVMLAHNAGFEMAIWRHILTPQFGWPLYEIVQWRDTQACSVAANLPVTLEGVARVFKGSPGKDMAGNAEMRKLMKAEWDEAFQRYVYPEPTKAQYDRLVTYCENDCIATLFVWWRVPQLSHVELAVWHLDQQINQRGVCIDTMFVEQMARMAEQRKALLSDDVFRITGSLCANSTNPHALKLWLKGMEIDLPVTTKKDKETGETKTVETLSKDAVQGLLDVGDLDGAVRAVLDNRIEANKSTSLAKLKRVPTMVGSDGRLRGAFRYCIATTGRWASSGIQVHNLPKDKRDEWRGSHVRDMIRNGALETLLLTEARPLEAMSESLRAMLVSAPGCDFVAADFSAIEARVVAWLAGSHDALAVFAAGQDIYIDAAAKVKGIDVSEVTKQDRQLGKVCTLALGYGMGVLKFIDTARSAPYHVELDRKEAWRAHRAWRDANPAIVGFWNELEKACQTAVINRGTKINVGAHITVVCNKRALLIRLPSGRVLRYWYPKVKKTKKEIVAVNAEGELATHEFESMELSFKTVGKNKTSMVRESTYGGKLVENVTQAVARDLLANSMLTLDAAGYELVLHVHDSAVAEVAEGEGSVEEFERLMDETPEWAAGCPVATEGYRAKHFQG